MRVERHLIEGIGLGDFRSEGFCTFIQAVERLRLSEIIEEHGLEALCCLLIVFRTDRTQDASRVVVQQLIEDVYAQVAGSTRQQYITHRLPFAGKEKAHPRPLPVKEGGSNHRIKTEDNLLTHWLVRNEKQNKSYAYDHEVPRSKKAVLRYRVIGEGDRYQLLEVNLMTGRHHQIRCQLSAIGCPIKGDLKYGAKRSNPDGSISLLSYKVEFVHPVSKEPVVVTSPLFPDSLFARLAPQDL